MRAYTLDHLSDPELLRALTGLVARERITTAELLAHIAEVDARKLYAPAGYTSMFAYCVEQLRMSGDEAYKRIRAARAARRFPAIFLAVAEGRLHLTAVVLLAPYLATENAPGLLEAATHRTKSEIEELLARRFPQTEAMPLVHAIPSRPSGQLVPEPVRDGGPPAGACRGELAPEPVAGQGPGPAGDCGNQLVPEPVAGNRAAPAFGDRDTTRRVAPPAPAQKLTSIAPGRFVLQVTIDQETNEILRHAQALASHQVPTGDLADVLKRALGVYVAQLEKRKFAKTDRPRPRRRRTEANPRHIPANVKRAVWQRDGGRCTFVGETGHRCNARKFLEFDHAHPVARGGQATILGIRLRCRAHNQLEAERAFGAGFMNAKRDAARRVAAPRCSAAAPARNEAKQRTPHAGESAHDQDLTTSLRSLGFRAMEVRRALEFCGSIPDAPLEERVRAALRFLCPKPRSRVRVETGVPVPA